MLFVLIMLLALVPSLCGKASGDIPRGGPKEGEADTENKENDQEDLPRRVRKQESSLSPSLSPAHKIDNNRLERLADQVFDAVVERVDYKDLRPHKNKAQRHWVDRYYMYTVRVQRVMHLRDKPFNSRMSKEELGPNPHGIEFKHHISPGDTVQVLMFQARGREKMAVPGFDLSYYTFPEMGRQYRFFTQGIRHRLYAYAKTFPEAGSGGIAAVEPLLPNGVQPFTDCGQFIDKSEHIRRQSLSKSFKLI